MISFKQLRESMLVEASLKKASTPPAILLLRRRGFRMFPDGQKIAMYTADKYNLMITIPYGGNSLNAKIGPIQGIQTEGTDLNEYTNVFGGVATASADYIKAKIKSKYAPKKAPKPKTKPRNNPRQP